MSNLFYMGLRLQIDGKECKILKWISIVQEIIQNSYFRGSGLCSDPGHFIAVTGRSQTSGVCAKYWHSREIDSENINEYILPGSQKTLKPRMRVNWSFIYCLITCPAVITFFINYTNAVVGNAMCIQAHFHTNNICMSREQQDFIL